MKAKIQKNGQVVREFTLLPTQERFINSQKRFILFSGGFGCGKSLAFILKALKLSLEIPKNYGLLGRENYSDLRDSTIKDFFDICDPSWIKGYNKADKQVKFINGSEIIFRHLKEISKQEIASLNLGFFGVEQAEEVPEDIFLALKGRLRRQEAKIRQGFLTSNPALTWLFKYFKQSPEEDYELIEGSTLDNRENLPQDYIEDLLKYPERWKKQYVYGLWDESLLADKAVFPTEYIQEQEVYTKDILRKLEDVDIWESCDPDHIYQIGVDPSEGTGEDYSVIKCFDLNTGEEVAKWRGKIPPELLAKKVKMMAEYFNLAQVVPEINGIGLALLVKLKETYSKIYKREEFDKITNQKKEVLGWRTTSATKPLLIDNLQTLFRENRIKIRDRQTIEEMKTFVYSNEVKKQGMGAERGFHDDCLIATALAVWGIKDTPQKGARRKGRRRDPRLDRWYYQKVRAGIYPYLGERIW